MGFLQKLLPYKNICIQCHNNPDADAIGASFGIQCFLESKGIKSRIVYGGAPAIKKSCLKMMVKDCGIEIENVSCLPSCDLVLYVDCQRGNGNVQTFEAEKFMIIDHHIKMVEDNDDCLIKSDYQSCSTLVWELLQEEGFDIKANQLLAVALLYGLYTDTSCFADLYGNTDIAMRQDLFCSQPLFEKLMKSNMTVAELMIASDAMMHHYFDVDHRFAIIESLKCDQSVLGIIGDFMIQVDAIQLSFAYSDCGAGYQISLRSCSDRIRADLIAAYVCKGIGSGGGHAKKAGGYIDKTKFTQIHGDKAVFSVVHQLVTEFFQSNII